MLFQDRGQIGGWYLPPLSRLSTPDTPIKGWVGCLYSPYRLLSSCRTATEAITVAANDTPALKAASLKSSAIPRRSGGASSSRSHSLKGRLNTDAIIPAKAVTNHFCVRAFMLFLLSVNRPYRFYPLRVGDLKPEVGYLWA